MAPAPPARCHLGLETRQTFDVSRDRTAVARRAARVLLVDADDRVLLFEGRDPARPHAGSWWFGAGGGCRDGESPADAARREVREETGMVIGDPGPVVARRHISFELEGTAYDQDEEFFFVRVAAAPIDTSGWEDVERRFMGASRWWAIDELETTAATIFPDGLGQLLRELIAQRG